MTFGLFGLVINGILLAITAGLTDVLDVGGFLATILAALVISIVTAVLLFVVGRMFGEPESATGRTGRVGTGHGQGTTGTVCSESSSGTSAGSAARTASTRSTTAVPSRNANAVPPVGWSCAR